MNNFIPCLDKGGCCLAVMRLLYVIKWVFPAHSDLQKPRATTRKNHPCHCANIHRCVGGLLSLPLLLLLLLLLLAVLWWRHCASPATTPSLPLPTIPHWPCDCYKLLGYDAMNDIWYGSSICICTLAPLILSLPSQHYIYRSVKMVELKLIPFKDSRHNWFWRFGDVKDVNM